MCNLNPRGKREAKVQENCEEIMVKNFQKFVIRHHATNARNSENSEKDNLLNTHTYTQTHTPRYIIPKC